MLLSAHRLPCDDLAPLRYGYARTPHTAPTRAAALVPALPNSSLVLHTVAPPVRGCRRHTPHFSIAMWCSAYPRIVPPRVPPADVTLVASQSSLHSSSFHYRSSLKSTTLCPAPTSVVSLPFRVYLLTRHSCSTAPSLTLLPSVTSVRLGTQGHVHCANVALLVRYESEALQSDYIPTHSCYALVSHSVVITARSLVLTALPPIRLPSNAADSRSTPLSLSPRVTALLTCSYSL